MSIWTVVWSCAVMDWWLCANTCASSCASCFCWIATASCRRSCSIWDSKFAQACTGSVNTNDQSTRHYSIRSYQRVTFLLHVS
jgi:hypothetical protein